MKSKTARKIKRVPELARIISGLKKKGKKVVQCHGVFDIVHLGHIRHFNEAKKTGNILSVTITSDKHVKRGPGRPLFNEHLRAEALAALEITDYVCIVDFPTAIECIKTLKPDVYVKGKEYGDKKKDITGNIYDEEQAVKSVGGRLELTDDITFSSSHLLNNYLDTYPPRTVKYLKAIAKRYSAESIIEKLYSLKKMKALVIGDTIIDQYHYCEPMGKSSKEHLVANRFISDEMFAGGALATANNIASLCGSVDLLTSLGQKNSCEDFIQSKLSSNVNPVFFHIPDSVTTVKRRYVLEDTNRKLFEVCYMKGDEISKEIEAKILQHLKKVIKDYDVVIVADFGHGLLTKRMINLLCSKSKYLALNVQTNSANIGFNLVTKYTRADFVCIDKMELRFATHDKTSDLRVLAKKMYQELGCKNIIATRGLMVRLVIQGLMVFMKLRPFLLVLLTQ